MRVTRRTAITSVAVLTLAATGFAVAADANHAAPPDIRFDELPPSTIEAGETYYFAVQVTFPKNWPTREGPDAFAAVTGRGQGEDAAPGDPEYPDLVYCSTGVDLAAGASEYFACTVTAPSPGPFTLTVTAGEPASGVVNDNGEFADPPIQATKTLEFTVVAAD